MQNPDFHSSGRYRGHIKDMLANLISSAEVEISVELGTSHSTTQKQKAALSVSLGWGLIWHDMSFIKLQGAYPKTLGGSGVRRFGKIRKYLYRSWSAISFVWGVDLEWFGFWLGHAHCIWLAWFQRNQCCNSQQMGDRGGHYVAIRSNTCLCLPHCWSKGTCKTVTCQISHKLKQCFLANLWLHFPSRLPMFSHPSTSINYGKAEVVAYFHR